MAETGNKDIQGHLNVSRDINAGGDMDVKGGASIGHDLRVDGRIICPGLEEDMTQKIEEVIAGAGVIGGGDTGGTGTWSTEKAIPYNALASSLKEMAVNARLLTGPHVYQLMRGSINVGLLLVTGDSTGAWLNLTLITRQQPNGSEIGLSTSDEPRIYTSVYGITNNSLQDWKEYGGGTSGDYAGLSKRLNALVNFVGADEDKDDLTVYYDGNNLYRVINNILAFIGKGDFGDSMPLEKENLKNWINALRQWVGLQSPDPGDWEGSMMTISVEKPSDLQKMDAGRLEGKKIRSVKTERDLGYVKSFRFGRYTTLVVETMFLMEGDVFLSAEPGKLRTYACQRADEDAWSEWKLLREERITEGIN